MRTPRVQLRPLRPRSNGGIAVEVEGAWTTHVRAPTIGVGWLTLASRRVPLASWQHIEQHTVSCFRASSGVPQQMTLHDALHRSLAKSAQLHYDDVSGEGTIV